MMIELEGTQEYTNDDWTDMIHINNFILAFKKAQETRVRTTLFSFAEMWHDSLGLGSTKVA